jgi:hypothetical protein
LRCSSRIPSGDDGGLCTIARFYDKANAPEHMFGHKRASTNPAGQSRVKSADLSRDVRFAMCDVARYKSFWAQAFVFEVTAASDVAIYPICRGRLGGGPFSHYRSSTGQVAESALFRQARFIAGYGPALRLPYPVTPNVRKDVAPRAPV